jgi:DUF1680 family protein
MRPRWTRPDPRIDAVRGCVAVERGPLVYCAESLDDDPPLAGLRVDTSAPPADKAASGTGLDGVLVSVAGDDDGDDGAGAGAGAGPGARPGAAWPYGDPPPATGASGQPAALVPYHLWGNRGPATMRVWLPEDAGADDLR